MRILIKRMMAVQSLRREANNIEAVWEFLSSYGDASFDYCFQEFIASGVAADVIGARKELFHYLLDINRLKSLPQGSVGRCYIESLENDGVSAEKIIQTSDRYVEGVGDPEREVFGRRLRDQHDLMHLITGWGREPLGELCLLKFVAIQRHSKGHNDLANLGAFSIKMRESSVPVLRIIGEAKEIAKRSKRVFCLYWEHLLERDLESLRDEVGLQKPQEYIRFQN